MSCAVIHNNKEAKNFLTLTTQSEALQSTSALLLQKIVNKSSNGNLGSPYKVFNSISLNILKTRYCI